MSDIKWWIIELLGAGRPAYVESYSNADACPRSTFNNGIAKQFSSKTEAEGWAKQYLVGHNYRVVVLHE